MNELTGKGLLAAGVLLAAVPGWGYDVGEVVNEATQSANLDTRGDAPIMVSSVDEAFDLAWNNAADWRKDGDGAGDPVTLTATRMVVLPGITNVWVVDGEPFTLVGALRGEGKVNYSPALGYGYRFDFFAGEELKVTRFVAVGTDQSRRGRQSPSRTSRSSRVSRSNPRSWFLMGRRSEHPCTAGTGIHSTRSGTKARSSAARRTSRFPPTTTSTV